MARKNKKERTYTKIALNDPKSTTAEAFRTLRTNIQFANIDKNIKSIVMTSSDPDEGKSTVLVNLAITMAHADQKVLLIDADLRKPSIHKYFEVVESNGLTNILMDNGEEGNRIQMIPEVPGLHIITSGPIPPNPSELLSSEQMKKFIGKMKEKYDFVLIDSPPVGVVTDAAILSTIVEGTLLVCRQGDTLIESVQFAKEKLEKVNANILGVVLNGVKRTGKKYDYYYYNYSEEA